MRYLAAIIAVLLASASAAWAQNCVITGGINNGTITQNCTVIGRTKLTFQAAIAEELASKIPPGKLVQLSSIGSASDQEVANQYQQFLLGKGFTVQRTTIGMTSPPPDHPVFIQVTDAVTVVMIAPSAY
jgi:hypothetical protein